MDYAKKNGVQMVDFKFCDLPGTWQHFTTPVSELEEAIFDEGLGFDGSSIRGWKAINESDMLVVPDPDDRRDGAVLRRPRRCRSSATSSTRSRESLTTRDPRGIAKRAVQVPQVDGIGDTAYFGPEPEFFIFDSVRFDQAQNTASTKSIPSRACGTAAKTGCRTSATSRATRKATSRSPPTDSQNDIRDEMVLAMESGRAFASSASITR